ncbi:uncharacterized protein LOC111923228 [Cyanistes caeruleus]|uniref:uncharacterized protein LOC111923228 n=1 Tax=Cyanistes caeruleus TaxID=156563 RepID=UPI000CDACC1C|nr:uncharacterized protein LOC111923228 [Cyanistes caeruleus]
MGDFVTATKWGKTSGFGSSCCRSFLPEPVLLPLHSWARLGFPPSLAQFTLFTWCFSGKRKRSGSPGSPRGGGHEREPQHCPRWSCSFPACSWMGFPGAGLLLPGLSASHCSGSEWTIQRKLREFFAIPRCLVSVFSLFLVELIRFLGEAVVQALVVGVLTAIGDHVLKPFLAAAFHSLLQPLLLFLLKVLGGVRDLTDPVLDVVARVCSQLAVLLRAVRLVEIRLRPDLRAGPGDGGASLLTGAIPVFPMIPCPKPFAFYGQEQHVWSFPGCKIIRGPGPERSCWGPGWPGYLGGAEFTEP